MASLDDLMGVKAPAAAAGSSDASTAAAATGTATGASAAPAQSLFLSRLFGQLVQSTRIAHALPDADDFKFNSTASVEFAQQAAATQKQLLSLMGLLSDAVRHPRESSVAHNARGAATPGSLPVSTSLTSLGDSLDRFNAVVDTCDTALEKVDLLLDQHKGVTRGGIAGAGAQVAVVDAGGKLSQFNSSHTMLKPQRQFAHLIDNSLQSWIPIITSKPNAQTPLPNYEKLRKELEQQAKVAPAPAAQDDASSPAATREPLFPHPYKHEIENLSFDECPSLLAAGKEQLFGSLASVPCTWVDTPAALHSMAEQLEAAQEIAIDLEHHSWRSYQGLTCLMQVSTRRADWLVDTLALRASGELQRLNVAFTNPAIVKVLHGADSDIMWLQRDLGLYIVNLFDTGQAARVLELPKFSLAFLLQHYCDVTADKKYQLADWRIRPLTAEMLLYARMDTHFLLYIYDRLRNQLITRSTPAQNQLSPLRGVAFLLAQTLERSRQISLKTFEKESAAMVEAAAAEFAAKSGLGSHEPATRALHALFRLRDEVARAEDESVFFVCNNQDVFNIATQQPSTQPMLIACCRRPTPLLVREHGARVLAALQEARSRSASGSKSAPGPTSAGAPSPALRSASAEGFHVPELLQQTPSTQRSGGLPPSQATPATVASTLFSQLSTSTPLHQSHGNSGWQHDGDIAMLPQQYLSAASNQSPVMSTEQLYSSANWTLAGRTLERGIAAQRQASNHSQQQPQGVLSGAALSIPLFDLSGSDPVGTPTQRSRNASGSGSALTALLSPAPKHSTFSMLAGLADVKPDAQHREAFAEARASLLSGVPLYPGAATPLKTSTPGADDDSSMLRTPLTGEPRTSFTSPSPMSLHIIPSPLTVPQQQQQAPAAAAAATAPGGAGQFSSIADDLDPSASSGVDVASAPLPASMREIYKISNDNRRKKKRAKLSHELSGAASGGMAVGGGGDGDEDEAPAAPVERKKGATSAGGASEGESSTQFMKNIGWDTGAGGAASQPQQQLSQPNSAHSESAKKRRRSGSASASAGSLSSSPPSGGGVAAAAVVPFDYSSASLPPSNPASQAHFQPYADMGRDAGELRAAARDPNAPRQPQDPSQKIYKNVTMLKNASKSVTVAMSDAHQHAGRARGGSSGSNAHATSAGIPIPNRNQQQQRR